MNKKNFKRLLKLYKEQILDSHNRCGDETIIIGRDHLIEICTFLRDDDKMAFDMLSDVTAVDYLHRKPRFEVVYHVYSTTQKHRLRIRVPVEEGDEVVPTVSGVWKAGNWGEREVWDMFGIRFDGHPNLRRVLLYEEFEGHPLRKDYPIQASQPRMDLRRKERDAVEEFKSFYVEGRSPAES